jgi:hypothetical protein
MVNNLCQRLVDFQQLGKAEQEVLAGESALSRQKLSELEKAIPALIRHITQQQEAFAKSAEEILALVHFPVSVAETSSQSLGFFKDLVAWGSDGSSAIGVESAASEKIDLLKSRYTMASERRAHTAVVHSALASAEAEAASIERFDDFESPLPATAKASSKSALGRVATLAEPASPAVRLAPSKTLTPVAADLGENVELF